MRYYFYATITLAEAQQRLPELVRGLSREGELVITEADKSVARLAPVIAQTSFRDLKPGSIGTVLRPFPSAEHDTLGEMLDSPNVIGVDTTFLVQPELIELPAH